MDLTAFMIFGISFGLAAMLTPVCIWAAKRYRILDRPGGLKQHASPTPYLGGVALYLGFLGGVMSLALAFHQPLGGLGDVLIGSGCILLLGLIDDIQPLSIPTKFLWQGTVALGVAVFGDISIHLFAYEPLNILLSVVWVVGMTNAMNIIDIMDGLSGGVTLLVSLAFALLATQEGLREVAWLALALGGGTAGVLIYNWSPAKIYYGDAGALMMGFLCAALAMAVRYTSHHTIGYAAPLVILAVPLFDTFFVMWQRLRQGRSMFFGSPDHFPLRLVRRGWSKQNAVITIHTVAIVLSAFVLLSNPWPPAMAAAGYSIIGLGLFSFAWWLHRFAP